MQDNENPRRAEFEAELAAIARHIEPAGAWTAVPHPDESITWGRHVEQSQSNRRLWCTPFNQGSVQRIKFQATGWPSYRDESGREQTVYPSSLYSPRESTPSCTAARGRDPKQIAKQITRLLADYDRVMERCQEHADSYQSYTDKNVAAAKAIAEATGNLWEQERAGQPGSGTFYLRELPGETVRISLQGTSGEIRLDVDELVAVIDLLYRMRTGKRRRQEQYLACPECGCTDIEHSSWTYVNSDFNTQDEGPTDQGWCPQCETNGDDGTMKTRYFVTVDERQPHSNEGK